MFSACQSVGRIKIKPFQLISDILFLLFLKESQELQIERVPDIG
jgi:hypothetical protein